MEKKAQTALAIIAVLIIAWLLWSFADVNLHNSTTEAYSKYNAFVLLTKACK